MGTRSPVFFALWIPGLFIKKVKADDNLMCPDTCPGLNEVWGDEFEVRRDEKYEKEGTFRKTNKAKKLWHLVESQIETVMPYMIYKGVCNRKSNESNFGSIKCSNLCAEIMEVAVCNLAFIAVNMFVNQA